MAVAATIPTEMIEAALSASMSRSISPRSPGSTLAVTLAATQPPKALTAATARVSPIVRACNGFFKRVPSVVWPVRIA
jgi:hypothetical protein